MAFSSDSNNIEIKIRLDKGTAEAELKTFNTTLDKTSDEAKKVADGLKKTESSFSSLGAKVITLNQSLDLARKGYQLFRYAVSETFRELDRARELEGLQRGFESLSATVGQDVTGSLGQLKQATEGYITDTELMRSANTATLLGIRDASGAYERVTGDVLKLGKAMGIDAKYALDSFTLGTARQSRLWLDNLGIIIDVKKAYADFAASLQKTTDSLSESEKKIAFVNAAFKAAHELASTLPESLKTAGDSAAKVETAWGNLGDRFATAFSKSVVLQKALDNLAQSLDTTKIENFAEMLSDLTGIGVQLGEAVIWAGTRVMNFVNEYLVPFSKEIQIIRYQIEQLNNLRLVGRDEASIMVDWTNNIQAAQVAAENLVKVFDKTNNLSNIENIQLTADEYLELQKATNLATTAVNKNAAAKKQFGDELQKVQRWMADYRKKLQDVNGTTDTATDKTKQLADQYAKLQEIIRRGTGRDEFNQYAAQVEGLSIAMQTGDIDAAEYNKRIDALAESTKGNADKMSDMADAYNANKDAGKKWKEHQDKINEETLERTKEQADAAAQAMEHLAQSLADVLIQAAKGGDVGSLLTGIAGYGGGYLGGAIGTSIGGPIGAAIGSSIGQAVGDSFGDYILDKFKNGNTADKVGAAIDTIFPGVGTVIAKGWNKAFGGMDVERAFRGAVSKFFRETIEQAAPNGIMLGFEEGMKRVKGLDFSRYNDELLSGMTDQMRGGFIGIGEAFAQLFKDNPNAFEGFGGQMANVLANNLENLNNLQLMLEATGIKAEDLQKSIEKAYLDGTMGADAFLNSSASVQDLYTQGIPGAFGDTLQALNNLKTNGLESGRQALDAFGDMAAELKEKMPNATLQDLRTDLINAGASAEDVDKLFQAFAAGGIDSLDKLANISVQDTAKLVKALEGVGFAFEQPSQNADQLYDRLKKIDDMDPQVLIKVDAEFTENAQKAMSLGAGDGPTLKSYTAGGINIPQLQNLSRSYSASQQSTATASAPGQGASGFLSGFAQTLDQIVTASDIYKNTIADLAGGIIDAAAAEDKINALYRDGAELAKRKQAEERRYENLVEKFAEGKIGEKKFLRLAEAIRIASGQTDALIDSFKNLADASETLTPSERISDAISKVKSGEMSLSDAWSIISGAQSETGAGLAGKGDWQGALNQILSGDASKAMAGVKNLGVELDEVGMTLGEFMSQLDGKQFKEFASALSGMGWDEVKDLVNATDSAIIEFLNDLPSVIDMTVRVNVETSGNATSGTGAQAVTESIKEHVENVFGNNTMIAQQPSSKRKKVSRTTPGNGQRRKRHRNESRIGL